MYRYGIVSTASIVPRFVEGLRLAGDEAVAIASRNSEKAAAMAQKLGIPDASLKPQHRSGGIYRKALPQLGYDLKFAQPAPDAPHIFCRFCIKRRFDFRDYLRK